MGLMEPSVMLDVTITEYENGQIGFQVASYGRPVDAQRVHRLLAGVMHSMTQPEQAPNPAPLMAQETA